MAEGGVEDAALAVHLGPRDRKVVILAGSVGLGIVELRSIQAGQHVYLVARKILVLIDFVFDGEARRQMLHGRKRAVFDDDGRFKNTPRMLIEVAADHFAELGPLEKRVVAGVCADEALAVLFNERKQVGALLARESFAGA